MAALLASHPGLAASSAPKRIDDPALGPIGGFGINLYAQHVVFRADGDGDGRFELYRTSLSNGHPVQIGGGSTDPSDASFFVGSDWVVYLAGAGSGPEALYITHLTGTPPVRLAASADAFRVTRNRVVVLDRGRLFAQPTHGGLVTELAIGAADFDASSDWVVFRRFEGGAGVLYRVPMTGGPAVRVSRDAGPGPGVTRYAVYGNWVVALFSDRASGTRDVLALPLAEGRRTRLSPVRSSPLDDADDFANTGHMTLIRFNGELHGATLEAGPTGKLADGVNFGAYTTDGQGQRVYYVGGTSLYRVPSGGGAATLLSGSAAVEAFVFSPGHTRLYAEGYGKVYKLLPFAGFEPEVIDNGRDVAVDASGSYAVYRKDGGLWSWPDPDGADAMPPEPPGVQPADPSQVGLFDPAQGRWHLRREDGQVHSFYFGNPGDVPLMGDWDCDGVDTPGLFRPSDAYAYLRNSNSQGVADIRFFFGDPGDVPLAGDWNGDGCDTLSLYRPREQRFYIVNELGSGDGGLGKAEFSFMFGNPGDTPVSGDWDRDSADSVGLYRVSTGFFYWRGSLTTGTADGQIFFGDPGDRFVAGDWPEADWRDTPAVFRPSTTTFYFRNSLTQGTADFTIRFGQGSWLPVAGDFGLH